MCRSRWPWAQDYRLAAEETYTVIRGGIYSVRNYSLSQAGSEICFSVRDTRLPCRGLMRRGSETHETLRRRRRSRRLQAWCARHIRRGRETAYDDSPSASLEDLRFQVITTGAGATSELARNAKGQLSTTDVDISSVPDTPPRAMTLRPGLTPVIPRSSTKGTSPQKEDAGSADQFGSQTRTSGGSR
jgi:hypothetical protein